MTVSRQVKIVVTARGTATAEQVFDTLTDLRTHLEWGGRQQPRTARIRSLDAPEGVATVGTRFSSVGGFPNWRLHERHVVQDAARPTIFAFRTETEALATIRGKPWTAAFEHRYEISPVAEGSRVTYRFTQTRIERPPWRFRGPFRGASYLVVKVVARRGLRNLLAVARQR